MELKTIGANTTKIDMIGVDVIEYRQERLLMSGKQLIDKLNELGRYGWELMSHEDGDWLFKRVIRKAFPQ